MKGRVARFAVAVATAAALVPASASAHQAILGKVALGCGPQGPDGYAAELPIRGARVFARLEGSRWITAEERTDRRGRFRFDLPPGRYVVGARPDRGDDPQPSRYRVRLRRHQFPRITVYWRTSPSCS